MDLPPITQNALNKTGKIKTDEDIAYYLLFNDRLMITPLSYFGLSKYHGYMRITCSGGLEELQDLMNRLETRLTEARKIKQARIKLKLIATLSAIAKIDTKFHETIINEIAALLDYQKNNDNVTALKLKESNTLLGKILSNVQLYLARTLPEKATETTIKIQSWWRGIMGRKEANKRHEFIDEQWRLFINEYAATSTELKKFLLSLPLSKRLDFLPWRKHLQEINCVQEESTPFIKSKL